MWWRVSQHWNDDARKLHLVRRKNHTNLEDLARFEETEIADKGYRWLHPRAIKRMYDVSQDTIRQLIKLFHWLIYTGIL